MGLRDLRLPEGKRLAVLITRQRVEWLVVLFRGKL